MKERRRTHYPLFLWFNCETLKYQLCYDHYKNIRVHLVQTHFTDIELNFQESDFYQCHILPKKELEENPQFLAPGLMNSDEHSWS